MYMKSFFVFIEKQYVITIFEINCSQNRMKFFSCGDFPSVCMGSPGECNRPRFHFLALSSEVLYSFPYLIKPQEVFLLINRMDLVILVAGVGHSR